MSSTYSTNLRLELIGTGDQAGVWGATTNNNMGTLLDQAIAGYTTVTCSTTSTVLTVNNALSDQSRPAVLVLSGTPGANFSVFAPPGVSKTYIVCNSVSTYNATIYLSTTLGGTTALGTGVTIPVGKTVQVWTDGATGFFSVNAIGTTAQLTMNSSGAGAVSGSLFDGSVPQTISYNSIGAFPSAGGSVSGHISASSYIAIENANPLRLFSTLNAGYVDIYNNAGVITTSANIAASALSGTGVSIVSGGNVTLYNPTNTATGTISLDSSNRTSFSNAIYSAQSIVSAGAMSSGSYVQIGGGSGTQITYTAGTAPGYVARAWATFSISGSTISVSGSNVSSGVYFGVGLYRFNYTTSMPDNNVAVVGMSSSTGIIFTLNAQDSSGFYLNSTYGTGGGTYQNSDG